MAQIIAYRFISPTSACVTSEAIEHLFRLGEPQDLQIEPSLAATFAKAQELLRFLRLRVSD
jgi:hypothetical protein